MSGFDVKVGTVTAGESFTVKVDGAPCSTVTVNFYIDGVLQASQDVAVPGSATFSCPDDTDGKRWKVEVVCPGQASTTQGGVIS